MPINLPTYEQTADLLSKVLGIDVDVDTLITQLGAPTSAASSATSGNAHAKLNWLLTTLSNVYTNIGAPISTTSNAANASAHAEIKLFTS